MATDERRTYVLLCLGMAAQLGCNRKGVHRTVNQTGPSGKAAIARIWRGRVKRDRADEYEQYSREFGIKPLAERALGVEALREDHETETEFITISYWESVEAMSRFTGGDPRQIHHLPRDPEFLVEVPKTVQVLRIYESLGHTG